MNAQFYISDNAARRIQALVSKEGWAEGAFRVSVEGGGCSGFQYKFALEDKPATAQDLSFHKNGMIVLVDDLSITFLENAELDFVESMAGASFQIKNPNSSSSCGCGSSFAVKL